MKLRPLLRSLIIPIAALLALAAPPSRAAVEIITFGWDDTYKSTLSDVHVTASTGTSSSITLKNEDVLRINIGEWHKGVGASTKLAWDSGVLDPVRNELNVTVEDLCTNYDPIKIALSEKQSADQQGIFLDLSGSHSSAKSNTVSLYILGYLHGMDAYKAGVPWDIGLTGSLTNASLSYGRQQALEFYSCKTSNGGDKTVYNGNENLWLHLKGTLSADHTVRIPLTYQTEGGTVLQVYSIAAIAYTYDVPEPSSSFLALSGLLLLLRRRRRG